MDVKEVIKIIETLAPLSGAAEWDRSGVQIASRKSEIKKIGVTLDPMPGFVKAAAEWGADLIFTHHPLYFSPKPLDTNGNFLETVRLTLQAEAWLYAAHTSMDALSQGAAGWLADELELANREVLEPTDSKNPAAGIGIIGDLPKAVSFEEFSDKLQARVKREFWTLVGDAPNNISRVAYCPGSGGSLIDKAAQAGADIFVTGDVKYHQALEATTTVIDVGHFSLEERMLHIFAEQLQSELGPKGITFKFFRGLEPFTIYKPEEA